VATINRGRGVVDNASFIARKWLTNGFRDVCQSLLKFAFDAQELGNQRIDPLGGVWRRARTRMQSIS
jgi:hypothetical protein